MKEFQEKMSKSSWMSPMEEPLPKVASAGMTELIWMAGPEEPDPLAPPAAAGVGGVAETGGGPCRAQPCARARHGRRSARSERRTDDGRMTPPAALLEPPR